MSKTFGIIFDLDDTLLAASPVYYQCLLETMMLIEKDLYPDFLYPGEMLELFHDIEKRVWSGSLGEGDFYSSINDLKSVSTYPRELGELYAEALLKGGKFPTKEGVAKAYYIGQQIFDMGRYRQMPGVPPMLHFLNINKHVIPFILTRGEESLQLPKLRRASFKIFEKIVICPMQADKGDYIKKLMEEYDEVDEWIMVGDSITSDINPAITLGLLACHIVRSLSHIATGDLIDIGDSLTRYKRFEGLDQLLLFLKGRVKDGQAQVPVEQRSSSV